MRRRRRDGQKTLWLAPFGIAPAILSRLSDAADESPEDSGFAMDAPRPGKAGSDSIKVKALYSLFWIGPVLEATINRTAAPSEHGKRTTEGVIVPGKGRLLLAVHLKGTDDFTQDITAGWNIAADAEGTLKIEPDGTPEWGRPAGGTVWVDSATQVSTPPSASLNRMLVGTSETKTDGNTTTVNVGAGDVKVKGTGVGVNVGVSYLSDSSTSNSTPNPKVPKAITVTFNPVKLQAPAKPPPPEPKGTVTVDKTVVVDEEFVIGPLELGDAKKLDLKNMEKFDPMSAKHLKAPSVKEAVLMLYDGLPEETRNSLDDGKLAGDEAGAGKKIRIVGYTDNVGESEFNIDLSTLRAQEVREAFKQRGIPDNCFQLAHGDGNSKTPKTRNHNGMKPTAPPPDPDWRKVVIAIRYTVTAKGDEYS